MTTRVWLRCLIVSLVVGALMPFFLLVPFAPAEGERVIDRGQFTEETMEQLSRSSPSDWPNAVPMREVRGIERFTYWYADPSTWIVYASAAGVCFVACFIATGWVSYLNVRGR